MDMKIKAEKERQSLMAKKIESGTKLNEELKKEYTTQLALFKVKQLTAILNTNFFFNINHFFSFSNL